MDTSTRLVLQKLLASVVQYSASDLHLSVGNPPVLRVNGQLMPLNNQPIMRAEIVNDITDLLLQDEQKAQLEKEREIMLTHDYENKARFRVHIFFQQGFFSLSFRFIPSIPKNLDELGIPAEVQQIFLNIRKGLVLIVGPYGSGRTTTMASFVNTLNNIRAYRMITIEKPVEYLFMDNKSIVEQREVGVDAPSFLQAMESTIWEDFDVVMISEVPDAALMDRILDVAESDKLVFCALNAPNVIRAIEKIISAVKQEQQFIVRNKIASVLQGILAQKLIPGIDGAQKLILEVLVPDQSARAIIREGSLYQLNNIIQNSASEGVRSFDSSLRELVWNRKISVERALQHAYDPATFQQTLHQ